LRNLSEDRGGNQANLNGALMKSLKVPAPHTSMLIQIVKRIKAALTEIDKLENASKVALENIQQLPNRLLAQAFGDIQP
jgi:type I restriction enzyme, S subunit